MSYDKFSNGVSKMNFISYLRSRPALERRILAVCVYAAIAAVVVALWVVSFRDNLARIAEVPALAAPAPGGGTPTASQIETPASLDSPFGMLSQTWRRTREEFAAILAGTERTGPSGQESETPEPVRYGADATQESGNVNATEAPDSGEPTVRYLAEGARPPLVEGDPAAPAVPADSAPPPSASAAPASLAPVLAGKLAAAGAFGAESAPAAQNPAAREGGRIGFFAALAAVLSAAVRSLAGFLR